MWIRLDFTPLLINAALIGLAVSGCGLLVVRKIRWLGILIAVPGGLVVAIALAILISEWRSKKGREAAEAQSKQRALEGAQIREEVLAQDRAVEGMPLPAGSILVWRGVVQSPYPETVRLARPVSIDGVTIAGVFTIAVTDNASGQLLAAVIEKATLDADQVVQGVPCKGGLEMEFLKSTSANAEGRGSGPPPVRLGKLGRCRLAAEFSRDGLRLAAGSDVVFGRGGLSAGVLAADQMVGGFWGAKGSEVLLSEGGVERVTLARDQVIEGLLCLAGTEVRFGSGEEGRQRLESCTVGEVTEWKGVRWPRRTTLEWHEDSYLKATLTEDSPSVRIGEVVVFAGSEVQLVGESRRVDFVHGPKKAGGVGAEVRGMKLQWFNTAEDGSAWGELAEAEVVEGRAHAKGATVRFTLARPR